MLAHSSYRRLLVWGSALLVLLLSDLATAQTPFNDCATRTANNASLILPNDFSVQLNGTPIVGPWQIAVFTPEGQCAGTAEWNGEPTTLTAWGTDPDAPPTLTASTSALVPSDSMYVRLFHPSTDAEYSAPDNRITVSFRSGPPPLISQARYVPEGIYVLERVHIQRRLVSRQE